jgi:hypothetical protein
MEIGYQQWNWFNIFETSVMVHLNYIDDNHVVERDSM